MSIHVLTKDKKGKLFKGENYSRGYTIIYLNLQSSKISKKLLYLQDLAKSIKSVKCIEYREYEHSRKFTVHKIWPLQDTNLNSVQTEELDEHTIKRGVLLFSYSSN